MSALQSTSIDVTYESVVLLSESSISMVNPDGTLFRTMMRFSFGYEFRALVITLIVDFTNSFT